MLTISTIKVWYIIRDKYVWKSHKCYIFKYFLLFSKIDSHFDNCQIIFLFQINNFQKQNMWTGCALLISWKLDSFFNSCQLGDIKFYFCPESLKMGYFHIYSVISQASQSKIQCIGIGLWYFEKLSTYMKIINFLNISSSRRGTCEILTLQYLGSRVPFFALLRIYIYSILLKKILWLILQNFENILSKVVPTWSLDEKFNNILKINKQFYFICEISYKYYNSVSYL